MSLAWESVLSGSSLRRPTFCHRTESRQRVSQRVLPFGIPPARRTPYAVGAPPREIFPRRLAPAGAPFASAPDPQGRDRQGAPTVAAPLLLRRRGATNGESSISLVQIRHHVRQGALVAVTDDHTGGLHGDGCAVGRGETHRRRPEHTQVVLIVSGAVHVPRVDVQQPGQLQDPGTLAAASTWTSCPWAPP